jgi:gamma-glutamylcyclotransferase (GGCT)/AIG2-like uncharacterized protein YtfP
VTHLLFVYGTLRQGYARHSILRRLGARWVGKGSVPGELFDLGEFPGARPSENGAGLVVGEVYRLPNVARAIKVLDSVEGHRSEAPAASLFRRETTLLTMESKDKHEAWIYWLKRWPSRLPRRIPSGDYTKV